VTDNGDGTYTIVPNANYNGTLTLSYTVSDGNGGSVAASQSVSLSAVNDAATGNVTISGELFKNETLTASHELADADGMGAVTYQWLRNGLLITGSREAATSSLKTTWAQ
jgi:hypothetical protein